MATIYVGNIKYELGSDAIRAAANDQSFLGMLRSFVSPVESAINDGINIIMSGIGNFMQIKNSRRRDEQSYLRDADNAGYNQENNMLYIIIVVIFLVVLIYLGRKKK